MERTTHRNYLFFLILFLSVFSFLTGCSEKISEPSDPPSVPPSVAPTKEQLAKSSFLAFTQRLESIPEEKRGEAVKEFLAANPHSPVIEESALACFFWYGKADTVIIKGDIQLAWSSQDTLTPVKCGDSTLFYKICALPADARVDYLYLVDGFEITDPRNPVVTPSGFSSHSQCAMPLFKPDTVRNFRPDVKHGRLDSMKFGDGQTAADKRTIKIYLPAGYDTLKDLPSLYINDGIKALQYCSYKNILDNLIVEEKIAPMIAVFIEFREGDQDFYLNKTDEYTSFICESLMPFIDKKYKTSALPEKRGIAGISAGGHISLLIALKRPDKFLLAAGQSSTLTPFFFETVEPLTGKQPQTAKWRFWLDVGKFDLLSGTFNNMSFLSSNRLLDKKLTEAKIEHKFTILNDGHQWANWRERTDDILIYFFGR
ncbi:MAG: hypothetical protein LCH52_00370 [Bacteroidetes bacterium]|nr:hypothetical protein [Bacteroidota bacterium]